MARLYIACKSKTQQSLRVAELFLQAKNGRRNEEGRAGGDENSSKKIVPTTKHIRGATRAAAQPPTSSTHPNLSPLLKPRDAKANQHPPKESTSRSIDTFLC
jgi:hypothetical protein